MEVVLRKYGNSTVVALPPSVLKELVLTTREFNCLGDVLVAPITQGGDYSRHAGFAVTLAGSGCKTQGVALMNKIRMLDLSARKARKVERVPAPVVEAG